MKITAKKTFGCHLGFKERGWEWRSNDERDDYGSEDAVSHEGDDENEEDVLNHDRFVIDWTDRGMV